MRHFTTLSALCCAAALGGCAKTEKPPAADTAAGADETPAPAAAAAAPAPIALADVAGKWKVRGMSETSDSTIVSYDMTATADPSGWTVTLPHRKPMSVHITAAGDSIVSDAGPYESVLRKGVQVTTHGVMRLQDGKLVGTTVAHYATKSADSVRVIRTEGTRAP